MVLIFWYLSTCRALTKRLWELKATTRIKVEEKPYLYAASELDGSQDIVLTVALLFIGCIGLSKNILLYANYVWLKLSYT